MHVGFPFIHASPPAILERLSLVRPPIHSHHSTEVAFANAELQYQGFRA
jgi:hypothetical protein